MAYGDFGWSVTTPGKIENIKGWESVFGFEFIKSQIRFGFDFLYRDIEFDYKAPSGQGVSTNQNSIDYSGYSIKGAFSFFF